MNKKTKARADKAATKARLAREGKLIAELCSKHGYMFQDAPKGQRITMTYDKTIKRVDASYKIFLIVPSTSALGKQFAERYKQLGAPKVKK